MRLILTIFLCVSIFLIGIADFAVSSQLEAPRALNDEISLLGRELNVAEPKKRLSIISQLGATQNPRAIAPLLKALKDHRDDFQLRQAVIMVLGDIQDTQAVDTAIEALRDYTPQVRKAAAEALGKLGDKKAVVPLLITFDDKEASVREAAVDSLTKLGEPAARIIYEDMYQGIDASKRLPAEGDERLYDYIIEAFQHWETGTRENAVWVLGRIQHEKIMDFLIRCLGDNSSYVSAAAVWSLQKSLDARATAQLISVLNHPSPVVREAAAYTLGNAKNPDPVPSLIETLKDDKSTVREAATWSLSKIKDQRAVEPLCKAMADPDPRVRIAAAHGLGALEISTISFDVLIEALRDKNAEVREAAAFSFAKPNERRASSAILKALEDSSEKVRKAAAHSLGKIGDPSVADRLLRSMSDIDPAVREAVAEALDELNSPLGQLINKFFKGDREAGAVLVVRGDPRVAQLFLDELDARASVLRPSAVWYLAEIGEPRAQKHFVRMARGWNIGERFKGGMALSKLELRPIYKNLLVSIDVLTSPPSITYFLLIVFLSGVIFYAACPYSPIIRILYALTFGSMIAGGVFNLSIFSFSWLYLCFFAVSIFPFIVLGSLSALVSLHPSFRFFIESGVDFRNPMFSIMANFGLRRLEHRPEFGLSRERMGNRELVVGDKGTQPTDVAPTKTHEILPAELVEQSVRRPWEAVGMGNMRPPAPTIMQMLRPVSEDEWLATPRPMRQYVESLEQRVLQLEDTVAQVASNIEPLESLEKRVSQNPSKPPYQQPHRPKRASKRKHGGRKVKKGHRQ